MAGGTVASVAPLATALFPVLFIGLTALTITSRTDAGRAVLAGAAAVGLLVWPAAGALGAIVVALTVTVAIPAP